MQIRLIAVGEKMPRWVEEGYAEYARRLPPECALKLTAIPAGKRGKGADLERLQAREGEKMQKAVPKGAHVVALDQGGKAWSTEALAGRLEAWLGGGRDVALLVGGPEGLAPACLAAAGEKWSLSPLTLPHPLVRVLVAEQLFRAWSLLTGHPYHR